MSELHDIRDDNKDQDRALETLLDHIHGTLMEDLASRSERGS